MESRALSSLSFQMAVVRKGDAANPVDRSKPKAGTDSGPNGTGSSGVTKKREVQNPPC